MRADIPIGRILSRHRIESRREITDAYVIQAGTDLARTFNVHRCESMLSRKYRIIHREEPLIAIEEVFPARRLQTRSGCWSTPRPGSTSPCST